ncbi:MAG: PEP/pyruvate-binding domain-containing protein [Pseudomonadota bacterium]
MPEKIIIVGDGQPGGKGSGLLKLQQRLDDILNDISSPHSKDKIEIPQTIIITTSAFREFVEHNKLETLIERIENTAHHDIESEKLANSFLTGEFTENLKNILLKTLDEFETPVIVRSSSLLEDQKGAAFAGKYQSIFLANQGEKKTRQEEFLSAIKKVYSSTYNPDAIAYRHKHGFADSKEEMALVIQAVVGNRYGDYYLPAMAGVGFSQNGYCWNKEIKKSDGLVRLVFGLGTSAVGRGYVRLFSPAKPLMRPEGTDVDSIQKCSQKKVDVIDLKNNSLKTVHFRELIPDGLNCYKGSQPMISLRDGAHIYRPVSNIWDKSFIPVLNMDGVLTSQWMKINIPKTLGYLLLELEKRLGFAIDMEFAINFDNEKEMAVLYILQVRPLSEREGFKVKKIPDIKDEDIIFSVQRNLPTYHIPDIEFLIYVDDVIYHQWPHNEKQSVARAVGKLNNILREKRFALIGPGRWGSWNPELGVPVSYAEISHTLLLVEVARRKATYIPEVSFGSHFFQDLIEDNIAYLPVYPDEPGVLFHEDILKKKSKFRELLPDEYFRQFDELIKVLHIPSIRSKKSATAISNGELERAIVYLE